MQRAVLLRLTRLRHSCRREVTGLTSIWGEEEKKKEEEKEEEKKGGVGFERFPVELWALTGAEEKNKGEIGFVRFPVELWAFMMPGLGRDSAGEKNLLLIKKTIFSCIPIFKRISPQQSKISILIQFGTCPTLSFHLIRIDSFPDFDTWCQKWTLTTGAFEPKFGPFSFLFPIIKCILFLLFSAMSSQIFVNFSRCPHSSKVYFVHWGVFPTIKWCFFHCPLRCFAYYLVRFFSTVHWGILHTIHWGVLPTICWGLFLLFSEVFSHCPLRCTWLRCSRSQL